MTNDEQESILIKMAINGDMYARGKLIECKRSIVMHVIKKFLNGGSSNDLDDFISVGTIGLIKGVNSYLTIDRDLFPSLSTYAARCIENEVLMYFRKNHTERDGTYVSWDEPIGYDDNGEQLCMADIIIDIKTEEIIEKCIEGDPTYDCLGLLSDKERMVILLRYGFDGNPMNIENIALLMNISTSYVYKLLKLSKKKITEQFKVDKLL